MSRYDWEAIGKEYRAGLYTVRELSRRHGPSESAIRKKIKEKGWEQDLSGEVRNRTRQKLNQPEAPTAGASDDEIIEQASDVAADVVRAHRRDISRWRRLNALYADTLEKQLEAGELVVGHDDEGQPITTDLNLKYIGAAMTAGTQALDRLQKAERTAYGMDEDDGDDGDNLSELMSSTLEDDDDDAGV